MRTFLLSLLVVAACTCGATAQDRAAQMPEWRGAILSGSPRLMLFSLSKTRPAGSLATRKQIADRLGFFHPSDGSIKTGQPRVAVAPILEYDQNVNGGIPGESFDIGPYLFTVNDGSRAKAAFVLGMRLAAGVSMAYDEGSTLDFSAAGTLRHAPAVDVTRTALRLSACANQHLSDWNWLVLCTGYKYDDARDIDSTEEGKFGSVGLRKIFSSPIGSHEATATITKDTLSDYDKLSFSGSVASAITGLGALSIAVTLGEKVDGENTLTRGFSTALARPLFGQSGRLSLGIFDTDGQNFFGQAREDRSYALSIGREFGERIWIGAGVRKRSSTVDIYDETEFSLDFSLTGWSF